MKILITGSSGFLGKFLCKKLEEEGHVLTKVRTSLCDLTKEDSLLMFQKETFDQIYHLAAWTQAGDFCLYHPGEQWIINQKINTNVLHFWQKFQPKAKLLAMGTSCGYDPSYPLEEKNYLLGLPIESLFSYAMTKRMLLCGLMSFQKQYGMDYLYVIPSTLYGPEYHLDGRQMHFIFDLIRKILRGLFYGEDVILWGDGKQKRELVHVEDFVEILVKLSSVEKNQMINIGAGEEYSIEALAGKICDYVGYPKEKIIYDTSKYVGAKSKVLCVDLLKKVLPSYKMRSLNDGLFQTIDWFLANKETLLQPKRSL